MKDMIAYGPSVYDFIAVYESAAIEQVPNALGRYGDLRVYYPPATIMSDHPFCVLNADWVKPDQAKAAQVFVDYLLSKPAQEKALLTYGFRPVDPAITLDRPDSPFVRYTANGLSIQPAAADRSARRRHAQYAARLLVAQRAKVRAL